MNSQDIVRNDSKIQNFVLKYYSWFLLFVVLTFIAITAYKIMEFPYFFFSDQVIHFDVINGLRGALFYPIGGGRFFPLAFFEFYPVLMSGLDKESIILFVYIIQAAKFVSFSFLLLYMLKLYSQNSVVAFLGFAGFFSLSKLFAFIPIFAHTIFPESMLLLMLVAFCTFYFHAKATDKVVYYIFALLAMTYALYLKEPVFSSFIVFAFMRLVFFRTDISKREKYFQYVILLNCMIFLCLYYLLAYGVGSSYNEGRVQGSYFTLLEVILFDYEFIIPIIIAFVRFGFVVTRKSKVMLADVFLLMSLAYMSCFVVLFLNESYYFLPAYFLLWPALALYSKKILEMCGDRLQFSYYFPVLLLLVITLSILMLREPMRRSFHVGVKVLSYESIETMYELREHGKDLVFFILPPDEYVVPFDFLQDSWVYGKMKHFLQEFKNLPEGEGITKLELAEFIRSVNKGNIGMISEIRPQVKSFIVENYPQYEVIDFGLASLVVHENYLESVMPIYCDFAERLEDTSVEEYYIEKIVAKAKKLGCDFSL